MTEKIKKCPAFIIKVGEDARIKRRRLGLNQSVFWGRVATTQSAGSRYEGSREMPSTVKALLQIAYGTQKQAADMVEWLRQNTAASA
jgi:hypothetical protein